MSEESGWQLTESDPGVFTELLKTLGVKLAVDDLYSLESSVLSTFQPIHALIFLFKWVSNQDERGGATGEYDDAFPGFFAHQVVNNACATLAVLNALLNIPSITLGPELRDLQSFTTGMDPQTRGMAITSSEFLREAHNALSPPNVISMDGLNLPKESEDAYHFVVYLPVMGCVYELDGLKRCPVRHGPYTESGEGWVAKAREIIEARIATYPPGSLEFNLMAIHEDKLPQLEAQLQAAQSSGNDLIAAELAARISQDNEKRTRWAFENSLRRHNHVGLVHALTLALAKAGRLEGAAAQARTKMKERIEKRQREGKMEE
ncbi:cysteine proteinase [Fomitiporia mediterranea MF3/22]|uniref:cysteine proteinase n=1 Tax=Fomitiporia mediterranea (strain MF3/22) TaxID=694068 RepID=UPI0004408831|nr:cysteine proteinase [Fomitiporia mediterranea MF3/22]EJD03422.1 cysteine proteinase [Fomitiporia mediterranea MF3/22]